MKNNLASLLEDSFSWFCKVYGKHVDQDHLRKEYIYFSKIFNSFGENINLLRYAHGRDIVLGEECPPLESDHETEVEIKPSMKTSIFFVYAISSQCLPNTEYCSSNCFNTFCNKC